MIASRLALWIIVIATIILLIILFGGLLFRYATNYSLPFLKIPWK